jgi:hypothetical protein
MAAAQNKLNGDMVIVGNLSATTMTPIANSVDENSLKSGVKLPASKLQAGTRKVYAQPNTSATSETRVLHRVYGATAAVVGFHAGVIGAAVGAATVTVDLKVNGTSILTSVITIDNTVAAYGSVAAALAAGAASLVAGNVLTIVITATAGGGTLPTGFFCEAVVWEDPS